MITKQNIADIYKNFSHRPSSVKQLEIDTLLEITSEFHGVYVDPNTNTLIINSIDPKSPFHTIDIDKINAIVNLDEWAAIVLHSSIIFLNKESTKIAIDIKHIKIKLTDRIRAVFRLTI